ncbi:orotidine-5'-phosphate decarboxylase [Pseudidiomarina tainanensis]|jgi:orotidine-5'-phosphate decarboxylase|uniref:Orotidine 5'-phosphate decarboxylase n=2 Tax=Pseudidiomarina TaxID=2800384 RepID=A0A1I6GBN7_9GAMM|nr:MULTISPECIES: orotidine-5'-phosphate decarboxylase [Pseudidiomarina]RZQ56897.1 orotidine-5'-phosphate decarboxylase [Pseudidiomarina tainanensis]SFR39605.1 orotidine-5'-phosphate decarboxylase [Pseudidiomarina maritima]
MTQQSLIFVALDYADAKSAWPLINQLSPEQCGLKVGKELFTSAGPDFVRELVKRGFKVFLDLKFHDIPTTVNKAVRAAAELGVWMVNVHASGGRRMLEAARDAVANMPNRPYVIAVTVLTSMTAEDLREVGIDTSPAEHVIKLAQLTKSAGLDGVVCSAWEAEAIAAACGKGFLRVTPGIRPVGAEQGDQRRIMTPPEAAALGIEVLVIGRPITQATDPVAALKQIQLSLTA